MTAGPYGVRRGQEVGVLCVFVLVVIARIEFAIVLKHTAFQLPSGYWYWLAWFSFLKCAAFCHVASFRLEVRLKGGVISISPIQIF